MHTHTYTHAHTHNTQIHILKYTNIQILKYIYSNTVQIKVLNTQYILAVAQTSRHWNVQANKCTSRQVNVYKCTNVQIHIQTRCN